MTARKPESTYSAGVNKHLPRALHKEKMNNPYRSGTADFWYSGLAGDLWTEYKWLPRRPRNLFRPALSELQTKWLRDRHEEGRNVSVIVGCPEGGRILRNLEWERDCDFSVALSRQEVALWIEKETCNGRTARTSNSSEGDVINL